MLGSEESLRYLKDRFAVLYVVASAAFVVLLFRVGYLQLIQGSKLNQYSEENHIRKETIYSPRGMIFDRDGEILVDNVPAFDVSMTPQFIGDLKTTAKALSKIIGMTPDEIIAQFNKQGGNPSFYPRIIKQDVTRDIVALISHQKLDLPGVDIEMRIKRLARVGQVGAQLLGYIKKGSKDELERLNGKREQNRYRSGDYIGIDGIEGELENILRGVDGKRFVQVDAKGRRKNISTTHGIFGQYPEIQPVPGKNVVLTIDQELQKVAFEAFGDKIGAAVAMDTTTGAVRVMVSKPSFDPTVLSLGLDREYFLSIKNSAYHAFGNKAIHAHQPPGSTFKALMAVAALEENVVTPETKVFCPGRKRFGRRFYHCHKASGHGDVNLHSALVQSCNVYFYNIATKMNVDTIARYSNLFGLGKLTGIELSREIAGLIPTAAWKQKRFNEPWQDGETLSVSIGQGFVLATPLQLAVAYGAIANGGTLLKPYVLKEVRSPTDDTPLQLEPLPVGKTISIKPETLAQVRKGLFGVVNEPQGTARGRRLPNGLMAGKTGTSQVRKLTAEKVYEKCEGLPFEERRHALFVGYAPSEQPELVVSVLAEHACHGSSGAGEIAKQIVKAYFEKKKRRQTSLVPPPVTPAEVIQ